MKFNIYEIKDFLLKNREIYIDNEIFELRMRFCYLSVFNIILIILLLINVSLLGYFIGLYI